MKIDIHLTEVRLSACLLVHLALIYPGHLGVPLEEGEAE